MPHAGEFVTQTNADEGTKLPPPPDGLLLATLTAALNAEKAAHAETRAKLEAELDAKLKTELELKAELEAKIGVEVKLEAEIETKAELKAKLEAKIRNEAELEAEIARYFVSSHKQPRPKPTQPWRNSKLT